MPKMVSFHGRQVPGEDVSFSIVKEDWNTYQLHDGTELRMRLVVKEITRVTEEYDQQGNPVYAIQSTNVVVTRPPDNFRKQPE